MPGHQAVCDRAVRHAGDTTDILLAADITVKQGQVLDIGLVVLVSYIAKQADVFFRIIDLQVLDSMILPIKRAKISLFLLGSNRQESLHPCHIDISREHKIGRAVGWVLPGAGEIEQLIGCSDFVFAGLRIVCRRRASDLSRLFGCRGGGNCHSRENQRHTEHRTEQTFHLTTLLPCKS